MKHPEAVEALLDIERHVDVNSFWVGDIQVWPLLRRDLWMQLLSYEDAPEDAAPVPVARPAPPTGSARPHGSGAPRGGVAPPSGLWEAYRRRAIGEAFFSGVAPCDVLFLSRAQDHTETFADGRIDRIVDPVLRLARKEGLTTLKVSVNKDGTLPGFKQVEPSLLVSTDRLDALETQQENSLPGRLTLAGRRRRWQARRAARNVRPLLTAVAERLPGAPPTADQMVSALRRLDSLARLFGVLLDRTRPRLAMCGVFYTPEAMALAHACRRRGIPLVDIQHGKQGRFHGLYGHWSALPPEGYSLLPDIFWNWGQESAEIIRESLPAEARRPVPVVGGNCWLGAWKRQPALPCLPGTEALLHRMAGAAKTILLSLQPIPKPIPRHVLTAMKQAPADWLWLVRLHPHHRAKAPEIEAQLTAEGIAVFDVAEASAAPLYPLLSRVDAQITCWSSVAYEALAFDKPAVLVHPMAKTLYNGYIEEGYFAYADTADALLERLFAATDGVAPPEKQPYIEASEERAREALGFCLNF